MLKIREFRAKINETIKKQTELTQEISRLNKIYDKEFDGLAHTFKDSWSCLRKNLAIIIMRNPQNFSSLACCANDILIGTTDFDGKRVSIYQYSASAKSALVYKLNNNYNHFYFTKKFFHGVSKQNVLKIIDTYSLIYEKAEKMASEYKSIKNQNELSIELYYKHMKRYRLIEFIDEIEIWRGSVGDPNYPIEKFNEEIQKEKNADITKKAIKSLRKLS